MGDRGQAATCWQSSIGSRLRSIPRPTSRDRHVRSSRLSYPKAVAWIVARLAEALDYAYSRGVLHGDVKPSNILLTAAGEPMLLDFNLAVGWRSPGGDDLPADVGGTLAYMAPDASDGRPAGECGCSKSRRSSPRRPVCAGYGPARGTGWPDSRSSSRLATYAAGAGHGVRLIATAERGELDPIVPGVDCSGFAVDPVPLSGTRFRRSLHAAPWSWRRTWIAGAASDPWPMPGNRTGGSAWLRWARRRRLAVAAVAVSLVVAAICTLAVWTAVQTSLREKALAKLAHLWDDSESKAFRFGQFGHWRPIERDAPEDLLHHLGYYNVLGAGDPRTRDEFRATRIRTLGAGNLAPGAVATA